VTYSIVIPVHNEGGHIRKSVHQFYAALPETARQAVLEIILVENGSTDNTPAQCHALEDELPGVVRALRSPVASYGAAIKLGMMQSRGTHLSILEADVLAVEFVVASMRCFDAGGAAFIVGSKRHAESRDRRPWKRRMLTWGFNVILKWVVGYPGTDTHGLKSIETAVAKRLCALAQTSDELLQTEIVVIADRLGYEIAELPVSIEERRPTPVSIMRRAPKVIPTLGALRKSARRFPRAAGLSRTERGWADR
jgi:dolichyl-phosphate beta-glucosyltransferase